jgi:hypothetical protein
MGGNSPQIVDVGLYHLVAEFQLCSTGSRRSVHFECEFARPAG